MKNIITRVMVLLLAIGGVTAQDSILTASSFFDSVSKTYGTIQDYEANMSITTNDVTMLASVSFKQPNLLRIDFSDPASQVILFNGDMLTIYLPGSNAILSQSGQGGSSSASGANLATPQGLVLMQRYYAIGYETGQTPVPLESETEEVFNTEEMVINLLLSRKNTTEGFRTIKLSIDPESLLIRRVEAVSTTGQNFVFTFSNYKINQNIPDQRFVYTTPSSANTYTDFLYTE